MTVLDLRGIDVWFPGGPQVLDDVSLQVAASEHWALLGPNGAGKSTLLSVAGATRFPSAGRVEVLGRRLGTVDLRELRRDIGVVDPSLRMPAELTVVDYVATGVSQTVQPVLAPTAATRERVEELVERFGLADLSDRPVGVCSQGERARARLARALVHRPALLLLDEPAAGLDLPGRADLIDAVEDAVATEASLATVMVAHHLEELPATTTHVALLRDGRLQRRGTTSLLTDSAALTECFGRPITAVSVEGRWLAVAGGR